MENGARQDLHSFPTRRSSDLGRTATGLKKWRPTSAPISSTESDDVFVARDRKSTRLNSSHLGISYAVFCLKKKKRTAYYRPRPQLTKRSRPQGSHDEFRCRPL